MSDIESIESKDEEHRQLALSILETSERELVEQFMRCDRREALDFLSTAAEAYRLRCEDHIAEAELYRTAAEKLDFTLARLSGPHRVTASMLQDDSEPAHAGPKTPEVDPPL